MNVHFRLSCLALLLGLSLTFAFSFTLYGQYAPAVDLTDPRGDFRDIELYDIDLDGDLDAITIQDDYFNTASIDFYENDGSGNWTKAPAINNTLGGFLDIEIADLNGDEYPDILLTSPGNSTIGWHANDGSGNFGALNVISDTISNCRNAEAVDLDGDGDLDLLTVNDEPGIFDNWSQILRIMNLGGGTFGPAFVLSSSPVEDPYDITAADLDGDGDQDAIVASINTDDIHWYENLGGGTSFGPKTIINNTLVGNTDLEVADIDGDGDIDIATNGVYDDRVCWLENNGGATSFTKHRLSPTTFSTDDCTDVSLADVDGDGDLDVLAALLDENAFHLYRNLGSGNFASFELIADRTFKCRAAEAGDLDGDGNVDLVSGSGLDSKLVWYKNLGSSFSSGIFINTGAASVTSVSAADVDSDGDLDVLSTSAYDDKLAWYENLGGLNFAKQQLIATDLFQARGAAAADLNADGLTDLVAIGTAEVVLYLKTPAGYSTTTLASGLLDLQIIELADLNGDGLLDITFSGSYLHSVNWMENLGSGSFGSMQILVSGESCGGLKVADMDADGDNDLLYGNYWNDDAMYLENLGGAVFASPMVIGTGNQILSIDAADLDGDGDLDAYWSALYANKIYWAENIGGGSFALDVDIKNLNYPRGVTSWDPDGDGDIDILAAAQFDNKFFNIRNNGDGTYGKQTLLNIFEYPYVVAAADLDGDGDEDMLAGFKNTVSLVENLRLSAPLCNAAVAPTGLSASIGANVTLSWNAVPASAGCQVRGRKFGTSSYSNGPPIVGSAPTSWTVASSFFESGETYEWNVRCACSLSPIVVTPFSVSSFFTMPEARLAESKHAETSLAGTDLAASGFAGPAVWPNPASNQVTSRALLATDRLELYSLNGQLVLSGAAGSNSLSLETLADGLYHIGILHEDGSRETLDQLLVK